MNTSLLGLFKQLVLCRTAKPSEEEERKQVLIFNVIYNNHGKTVRVFALGLGTQRKKREEKKRVLSLIIITTIVVSAFVLGLSTANPAKKRREKLLSHSLIVITAKPCQLSAGPATCFKLILILRLSSPAWGEKTLREHPLYHSFNSAVFAL